MQRTDLPVNISLLLLRPDQLQRMKPVRVLDIFDGGTTNFHEDGLFSISIFGRIGSDDRDKRFSFIDLRTEIFHPYFYKQLCQLKQIYKEIMSGKVYAVWDPVDKDFARSDAVMGQTGYHFFMQHWRDIEFKRTGSDIRDLRIAMIQKYRDRCTVNKILVMPAGLRDIQIDEGGRIKEGEVNEIYRAIISISNAITSTTTGHSKVLDTSRHSLQMHFNRVYEYIIGLLEGKGGFFQKKWGARRIFNGTRNVITSMDTSTPLLGGQGSPKLNNTVMGLFQTMKGSLPKAKYLILNGWLSQVFSVHDGNAQLVNPVTLRRETVTLPPTTIDRWTTASGIESVINGYFERSSRVAPVKIEDFYLGLIYRGPNGTFRIFGDIEELPDDPIFGREYVFPLTLCELLYLSGYRVWNTLPVFVTRYPITGAGSIYPSYVYIKNTVHSCVRQELGHDWQPLDADHIAYEYPIFENPVFVDTMMPHPSRLGLMGADFDGDTTSANILYSDDAIAEVGTILGRASSYLDTAGGLVADPVVDTVQRVLMNFTGS